MAAAGTGTAVEGIAMKICKTDYGYYVATVRRERGRPTVTHYLRRSGRWCNLCPPDGYHRRRIGCAVPLLALAIRSAFGMSTEDFGYLAEDFYT